MSLSKTSYAFFRSRKIAYKTYSLMYVNRWISLALREVVPVPRPAQKLWRTSWKEMEVMKKKLSITVTTLQTTSTRKMTRYYPLPLETRNAAFHVDSSYRLPSRKSDRTNSTTLCQCYRVGGSASIISIASVIYIISVYNVSAFASVPVDITVPVSAAPDSAAILSSAATAASNFQYSRRNCWRCYDIIL